jgi:hypothetical protein
LHSGQKPEPAAITWRARWAKRAPLILLVVIGLFFWIPQLLRATVGENGPTTTAIEEPAAGADKLPAERNATSPVDVPPRTWPMPHVRAAANWKSASGPCETDPLAKSAELAGLSTAIFRTSRDASGRDEIQWDCSERQLGIRLAGQINPKPLPMTTRQKTRLTQAETDGLVLSNTILGETRRAAIINGRLYREGDRLSAGGRAFRVTNIGEYQIELERDGRVQGRGLRLSIRVEPDAPNIGGHADKNSQPPFALNTSGK